jgi:TatD DNase family protein
MKLVDSHIHIYAEEFDRDRDALIKKAAALGVERLYMPNIDAGSIGAMLDAEARYPGTCFPMMGLHPCSVTVNVEKELKQIREWLEKRRFAAIGEIGIDLHWDKTTLPYQETAFRTQVEWALEFGYPVVIHSRKSLGEILAVLKSFPRQPGGIFHCFSGSLEEARRILELGSYKLGIGGVVTFKNAGLAGVVKELPLSALVLETDAPYLAPVPFRGKRNEPGYLLEIAKTIAQVKDIDITEVALATTQNAVSVFANTVYS